MSVTAYDEARLPRGSGSEVTVRRFLRGTGWTLIGMGCFVLYFLVYQLIGTDVVANQRQSTLRDELEREWSAGPAAAAPAGPATAPVRAKLTAPSAGRPLAIIAIPRLKLERVVVEGAGTEELKKGPGHITGTDLPGQPGNFAVSGHRTTYGRPFYRLDELAKGDVVIIETGPTVFTYTVTGRRIVRPSDVQVLDDIRGPGGQVKATITLTTCNPRFSARERLVVFGELTATAPNTRRRAA